MSAVIRQSWSDSPTMHGSRGDRSVAGEVGSRHTTTVMTLTRRGKAVFAGLGAAAVLLMTMGAWNVATAQSAPGIQEVTSYVVHPGDTLWSYAQSTTAPGGDVRETVAELMELNNMESSAVSVGQRLVVPIQ